MNFSNELVVATRAAFAAGGVLMANYGSAVTSYKEDRSLVTDADVKSEESVRSILSREFPDHSILGEESGLEDKGSDYLWIVDPLDGTTNYTIKNPFFDVSIGLNYKKDHVLGVVYYPVANELFQAEKGEGAYLNGRPLKVSERDRIEDSVITFCNNRSQEAIRRMAKIFSAIKPVTNKFRQLGAGGLELSYVASGRTDAFIMPEVNSWDVAAGTVLVREAGGRVTDFEGKPYKLESNDILASNGKIHDKMLELLSNIKSS